MRHTLIALACTLAVAGGNALAQDRSTSSTGYQSSGESVGQKAKNAAHRVGEKTRNLFHRGENKVSRARSNHDARTAQEAGDDTRAMGASSSSAESERQKRMDQAYNDYKSGRGSASQSR